MTDYEGQHSSALRQLDYTTIKSRTRRTPGDYKSTTAIYASCNTEGGKVPNMVIVWDYEKDPAQHRLYA